MQAERERNSRILLEAANICRLKNEAERGRTALSLPPGATAPAWADLRARLPTEVKPGTCRAGRSGRAQSSTKGQKLSECTAPGPGEPRTRGKVPSHSGFINLPLMRSINKNEVKRPWSLCVGEGRGGQRYPGRSRRPLTNPVLNLEVCNASDWGSRAVARTLGDGAGPLIGCIRFNSGHC